MPQTAGSAVWESGGAGGYAPARVIFSIWTFYHHAISYFLDSSTLQRRSDRGSERVYRWSSRCAHRSQMDRSRDSIRLGLLRRIRAYLASTRIRIAMKRVGSLFEPILDRENFILALHRAARSKRYRPEVREFQEGLTNWLASIAQRLISSSFTFGRFHQFLIRDPKERIITSPCFEDRVVHHAIMNVCDPEQEQPVEPQQQQRLACCPEFQRS